MNATVTSFQRKLKHPQPPQGHGDWMQTFSGKIYFPTKPRVQDVRIEDIAHALSLQCRYGGQIDRFYSVAEHSYWVSLLVPEHALMGLVHDASEGYLIDIPRPAKVGMPDYRRIEEMNWQVICQRFGWDPVLPHEVHDADNGILFSERDQGMKPPMYDWKIADPGWRIKLGFWSPAKAEKMWLRRYRFLTGGSLSMWDHLMLDFHNKKLLKETSNAPSRPIGTGASR